MLEVLVPEELHGMSKVEKGGKVVPILLQSEGEGEV